MQRAEVGEQDDEGERLGEEVVGAGVEGLGVVEVAALGREHQDRGPDALGPQVGADLEAVPARQHEVEDDGVVVVLARHPQTLVAVEREVDREAFLLQAVAHRLRQPLLVLDDQDPHAAKLIPRRAVDPPSW